MSSVDYDSIELRHQLSVLRKLACEYKGKTIDNIIQQIEERLKAIMLIAIEDIQP